MKYERATIDRKQALDQADSFWKKSVQMAEAGDNSMIAVAILQLQQAEYAYLDDKNREISRANKQTQVDDESSINKAIEMNRCNALEYLMTLDHVANGLKGK